LATFHQLADIENFKSPTSKMDSTQDSLSPAMSVIRSNGLSHPIMMAKNIESRAHANSNLLTYGGRRKITLRLEEDILKPQRHRKTRSFQNVILGHIRRESSNMIFGSRRNQSMSSFGDLDSFDENDGVQYSQVRRGKIAISWFEGTSSLELHEHVRQSIVRKLVRLEGVSSNVKIEDLRIIDETVDPPEGKNRNSETFRLMHVNSLRRKLINISPPEIVLSPSIPDGSNFVCRFGVHDINNIKDGTSTPLSDYSMIRPPVSPGAAPSPHVDRDIFGGLNSRQLALINRKLNASLIESSKKKSYKESNIESIIKNGLTPHVRTESQGNIQFDLSGEEQNDNDIALQSENDKNTYDDKSECDDQDEASRALTEEDDETMLHSEDPIETRFREIFQLLLTERRKSNSNLNEKIRREKRQVVFVVSNYLVLFMAVIAVCAEIQARAPAWLKLVENQLLNAHNCGATQEALFECVSRGDFAGLLASVGLWFSRSLATRRIFLFGFETPKKLWTVVYESLVTAVCWGISHLFIRRGLNPDTRERFVQKHWKDTVYGSLAGFFAAFLKMVLKNLVPQEVVEDALRDRRIKFLNWLPSLATFE
jgi:hypothetical protein